jgi:hypothetical protein
MKTHRLIVVSALLSGLALLLGAGGGGCASEYAEPPPAAAGVAGDFAMLRAGEGVTIVAIDGRHVASGATLAHGDQAVRVIAGPLKVAAYVSNAAGNARFEVPLTVQPNHDYRLERGSDTALGIRVVDTTTGQVVFGGQRGG